MSAPSAFRLRRWLAVLCLLPFAACAPPREAPYWGADATISPGWERVGDAALKAAKDPLTWAPAAGAAALQIGDLDTEIAEWANEETPLFGARETADDVSDWLRGASIGVYVGSGLTAPVGADNDWLPTKARGLAVGAAAIGATAGATELLKDAADRTRPLGQDDRSFPSGHASTATVGARLSHEALRYHDLAPGARVAADAGLAGLAAMTGWARVEAGEHHPADVLAGAALGNFIAVFATEAFLRPSGEETVTLGVGPSRHGWALRLSLAF